MSCTPIFVGVRVLSAVVFRISMFNIVQLKKASGFAQQLYSLILIDADNPIKYFYYINRSNSTLLEVHMYIQVLHIHIHMKKGNIIIE